MKHEENSGFTSFDFITLFFSLAVIIAVSAPIVKKKFQSDPNVEVAKNQLGHLGQDLLSPKMLNFLASHGENSPDRAVASISDEDSSLPRVDMESLKSHLKTGEWEGEVGKDPWGNPYHFSFIRNSTGTPTHVAVWSDGPNHKNETSVTGLKSTNESPADFKFGGDDLGSVTSIR